MESERESAIRMSEYDFNMGQENDRPLDCIIQGDSLGVMRSMVATSSIDMILADLPYGITENKWDSVIPLVDLWAQYNRVLKPEGIVALTASQPFTSILVCSNPNQFKHEWIWIKNRGSNFANTVREPFKEHESVLIFCKSSKWTYNPQMQERTGAGNERIKYGIKPHTTISTNYRNFADRPHEIRPELRMPSSWQKFNTEVGLHPTQKPVPLFEYLIRTYTNEGDTVLDNTIGSGTTALACQNTGRHFIGIDNNPEYIKIARERISQSRLGALNQLPTGEIPKENVP